MASGATLAHEATARAVGVAHLVEALGEDWPAALASRATPVCPKMRVRACSACDTGPEGERAAGVEGHAFTLRTLGDGFEKWG